jgi:hypothetical protein
MNDNQFSMDDSARESAELKIGLVVPQVRRFPMPQMSDGEIYLRLNVPDGFQTDGQQPQHYGIVQNAHPGNRNAIKSETGE